MPRSCLNPVSTHAGVTVGVCSTTLSSRWTSITVVVTDAAGTTTDSQLKSVDGQPSLTAWLPPASLPVVERSTAGSMSFSGSGLPEVRMRSSLGAVWLSGNSARVAARCNMPSVVAADDGLALAVGKVVVMPSAGEATGLSLVRLLVWAECALCGRREGPAVAQGVRRLCRCCR